MMRDILEGFCSHYSDSPLPALVEGLFFVRAPQDTTGIYATYSLVTSTLDETMSDRAEVPLIQLSIWGDEEFPDDLLSTAALFCLWYDDAPIDIAGGTTVRCDRQSFNLLPDPDGGWQVQIDYQLMVQEA